MKILSCTALIAAALLCAAPALADTVTYNLTPASEGVPAGGTVTFNTSIVAPGSNGGAIYILSDSFNCTSGCTVDDTDFASTPLELDPGQSYLGPLFTVTMAHGASGTYNGSFDITFEDSSNNVFIKDDSFAVAVTPEPSSWLLLTTGLAATCLLRRRLLAVASVSA